MLDHINKKNIMFILTALGSLGGLIIAGLQIKDGLKSSTYDVAKEVDKIDNEVIALRRDLNRLTLAVLEKSKPVAAYPPKPYSYDEKSSGSSRLRGLLGGGSPSSDAKKEAKAMADKLKKKAKEKKSTSIYDSLKLKEPKKKSNIAEQLIIRK